MKKVLNLYKPQGMTPFGLVQKVKLEEAEYRNERIGYAGRLDPMAEGVMLLLVGEENKKRKYYERLDKEYEFEVLFGFATDTYDGLGLVESFCLKPINDLERKIEKYLNDLKGKSVQGYPPYSYVRVKGKPLFWWARNNRLDEIRIPKKRIEIYDLELMGTGKISSEEFFGLFEKIRKVNGDFRQEEILKRWREVLEEVGDGVFPVAKIKIKCSSGVYVRGIANSLGKSLGTGGLALSIVRTRVGEFSSQPSS